MGRFVANTTFLAWTDARPATSFQPSLSSTAVTRVSSKTECLSLRPLSPSRSDIEQD